jgi:putative DNA primase/helicase
MVVETYMHVSQYDAVPVSMREEPRWCCWRYEERDDGKRMKLPLHASRGTRLDVTDSTGWVSFERAVNSKVRHDGIGFCLGDGWAGVDLDGCRNPETGELHAWARYVVQLLASYTEVSPSGTGIKIFVKGALPLGARHVFKRVPIKQIELYDGKHYFTVTGDAL